MAQDKGTGKRATASRGATRPTSKSSGKSAATGRAGASRSSSAKGAGSSKATAAGARDGSGARGGSRRSGTREAGASEPDKKRVTRKQAEEQTKKYRSKANKYKNDPEATDKLLKDAQDKAKKQKGPLSGRFDDIMTLIRLVKAYFKGEYRDVPWETIALAIGALIYFISPVDLIPDPIPVVGYVDDAAVIGFVVASIYTDLNTFRDWEADQKAG